MIFRERISQMYRREKLKLIIFTVFTGNGTAKHTMRMLPSYTSLEIERFIAVADNRIDRIDPVLEIESIVDIIPPIKLLLFRTPELHAVIAILQVREILVTRFNMAGLAIRIDIIHITTNRPAMFVLPGTVPLFALILFIKQVALEILHGIPPIFQIKTTGQLMPLIIKLMVETDTPLKISFMQVIIVATIIIAIGKRLAADHPFLRIIQVAGTGTTAITTFQINIERRMR